MDNDSEIHGDLRIDMNTDPSSELSRTIDLEVDYSDLTLGKTNKGPREVSAEKRRVFLEQTRKWRVSVDVQRLRHGLYRNQAASLVGFRFNFSSPDIKSRIISLQVRFSLVPAKQGEQFPQVRILAPHEINTDAVDAHLSTNEARKMGVSIEQPGFGVPLLQGGAWRETAKTVDYLHTFQQQLEGDLFTSEDAKDAGLEDDNCVEWKVLENELSKRGVPSMLRTAVVFTRPAPIVHGLLEVQVRTSSDSPLGTLFCGAAWSRSSPLILRQQTTVGSPLPCESRDFSELTDEDFGRLIGYDPLTPEITVTYRPDEDM
ncbi:hypothetical protein JDV02_002174 [Purpureocillium takamizusanense]|uniref:Uncharacterized protein n=1 Tax=Purpureocillium takamizusanense TaxID=2060973 RepID=A0A9Q8V7G0_9HYPO|nr:uncharacterized protein JDV02_002174 [Purpureocillium takamizusanense]UNI15663.1 hypothetical protein JDV02_002174 [Purpureocillium takamizusanense]